MPDFHGYGYGSWGTPGQWGGSGHGGARPRKISFDSGAVGTYGAPGRAAAPAGFRLPTTTFQGPTMMPGPVSANVLDWGKGAQPQYKEEKKPKERAQAFSEAHSAPAMPAAQTALGPGSVRGSLGPAQPLGLPAGPLGLPAAPPGALAASPVAGALPRGPLTPPGPIVMPSGPRPHGPAPTPLALPSGSAAPMGPTRRRRQEVFGQMMFGQS